MRRVQSAFGLVSAGVVATLLGACASIGSNAVAGFSGELSGAVLGQEDPDLVRDGLPSYLILLDALIRDRPRDAAVLGSAAQLYAVYGSSFVSDPQRASVLTGRAADYGARALCASAAKACGIETLGYEEFAAVIDDLPPAAGPALFSYAAGALASIRAHSADWQAIAALPRVEYVLKRLLVIGEPPRYGAVNMYLGVLNTLRPQALGGKPDEGRAFFEKAIDLTGGRDLSVKVEFARSYARLVYDRELHDRLLNEVIEASGAAGWFDPVQRAGATSGSRAAGVRN